MSHETSKLSISLSWWSSASSSPANVDPYSSSTLMDIPTTNARTGLRTTSDGLTTWRCSKHRGLKCPSFVLFNPTDESLSATKEHNHDPDPLVEQKKEIITSLKRKAEDQQLSSTQNILTETLSSSTAELNIVLPKLESLARVAQRARAKASGSVNHPEAPTAAEFELPPTCQTTLRDEDFVAYDGRTEKGARVIIFATRRNLNTLADYPNWIADGTFYVSPKQFYQYFGHEL